MPGKGDFGQAGDLGKYFPGDNSWKAWDEGFRYRYGGTALERPAGNNPYLADPARQVEAVAWNDGWNEADNNTGGVRRMPATSGAPPV